MFLILVTANVAVFFNIVHGIAVFSVSYIFIVHSLKKNRMEIEVLLNTSSILLFNNSPSPQLSI